MIEIDLGAVVPRLCDIEDSVRGSRIVVDAYSVLGSFVTIKPADGRGEPGIGHHSVTKSDLILDTPTDR